jgi:hypothetical protein
MSNHTIHVCDRCGADGEKCHDGPFHQCGGSLDLIEFGGRRRRSLDLCDDCTRSLISFIALADDGKNR